MEVNYKKDILFICTGILLNSHNSIPYRAVTLLLCDTV